jgi:hypothetical protein
MTTAGADRTGNAEIFFCLVFRIVVPEYQRIVLGFGLLLVVLNGLFPPHLHYPNLYQSYQFIFTSGVGINFTGFFVQFATIIATTAGAFLLFGNKNQGKPTELSEEEMAKMHLSKAINQLEKDAVGQRCINPRIIAAAQKIVGEVNKEASSALVRLKARGRVVADVKTRFSKTGEALQGKLESVTQEELKDIAEVGQAFLAKGDPSFDVWSKKLTDQLGDWVIPHLKQTYDDANKLIDAKADNLVTAAVRKEVIRTVRNASASEKKAYAVSKIKAMVADGKAGEIATNVQYLARAFVEFGIKDQVELIDAVHAELVEILPEITRRKVMDTLSDYRKFEPSVATDKKDPKLEIKPIRQRQENDKVVNHDVWDNSWSEPSKTFGELHQWVEGENRKLLPNDIILSYGPHLTSEGMARGWTGFIIERNGKIVADIRKTRFF